MNSNLDSFPIVNGFKLITPSRVLNSHTDTLSDRPVREDRGDPSQASLTSQRASSSREDRGDTLSQNWGQNLTSEDIEEMRNLILSCYYFKDIDNFFMNENNLNKYIDKDILKINKTLSHDS
jgi:sensor c-di-GMP phosphodiesterase-like protein